MGVAIAAGAIAVLLLVLAAFPYGMLRGTIEDRLAKRFGRPVHVGAMERLDFFGFVPTVRIGDVRVPQAAWAGSGDLARIQRIDVSFPVWPLLVGSLRPRQIVVRGVRLDLVRARDGRTNWSRPGEPGSGGGSTALHDLIVQDAVVSYRDAKRDRQVMAQVASDARGLRADGRGRVRGSAVTLRLRGNPVLGAGAGPWPFSIAIAGPALAMTARGATDRPLDTDAMTLDVAARGSDLRMVDAIVEAGLFATQPVHLAAHVRHEGPRWIVTGLHGTIGRSDIGGRITVDKSSGRNVLDGEVTSRRLDFDDLSSDEGIARGAALEARIGKRIIPNTRINLEHMQRTDGRLAVKVARIVTRQGSSSLTAMNGTIKLDHQVLTIDPFTLALRQGAIAGRVVVDQHGGARVPLVRFDLHLKRSSVAALASGSNVVSGTVDGRALVTGRGSTIREAVGNGSGRIGLIVRDGSLRERYAAALGFDLGKAVLAGRHEVAGLRCAALGLAMQDGRGTVDPLVVDTTQSQANGRGTVSFPSEALAISLTGASKGGSVLHVPGSVTLDGSIREPALTVPQQVRSAGSIFKAIGQAITGKDVPRASDANCAALTARMLR